MKRVLVPIVGLMAVSTFAFVLQSSRLVIDGKLASTGVIERNGVAYVPLKDVATALGKSLSKTSSGYELSGTGGANQINGVSGGVGDVLWNGAARFQVVKVFRGKSYTNKFTDAHEKVAPYPTDDDLVVVVCRIKNGTKDPWMCGLPGGSSTALTDTDEHSFGPDFRSIDAPSNGVKILPGAAIDFAITFDVPATTKLKDLVYEATFYGNPASSAKKFRVSLAAATPVSE